MTCGAQKFITGVVEPHVCQLPVDHDGPHVTLGYCGLVLTRWPVPWTSEDEARYRNRFATWRKPHVRRSYQTLQQWNVQQ